MTTQGKNINPRVRPSMKCRDIIIYGVKNCRDILIYGVKNLSERLQPCGLKCFLFKNR
jgi:hypothetical protein